ncbi:MAG: hypothetical protein V3R85_08715 [Alphaproteobacteria bacterium]
MFATVVVVFLATAGAVVANDAVHVLSESGTNLGAITTSGAVEDLRFTVDLQGDAPRATHVWATVGSNERRMRTNDGYWLPWNGDTKALVDNRFTVIDGKVVFKVMDEDISADNHGISVSIGYRVGDKLKYGVFAILPKAGSQ